MKFSVDARTILRLGRDSIRDHTTAVLELVKNSYDADAKKVEVEILSQPTPIIRIADDGDGMTQKDLETKWLRIGFSHKATDRRTSTGRRKTGEKGIGRISADRLGAQLTLLSKPKTEMSHGILVNWDQFDVDDKTVDAIDVREVPAKDIKLPGETGTELRIENLRQSWSSKDLDSLYQDLSQLVSPFKSKAGFQITVNSDIWDKGLMSVEAQILDSANLEFHGRFENGVLTYSFKKRTKTSKSASFENEIPWSELVQVIDPVIKDIDVGPVDISLFFFLQKAAFDSKFSLSEIKSFIKNQAGIRIYRDDVQVRPYGDAKSPSGDWLELGKRRASDPAGLARKTYKFSGTQIVGSVAIGRDLNPQLIDSSAREGLVENLAFYKLRSLVLGCVRLMEQHRHNTFVEESKTPPAALARESIGLATQHLNVMRNRLVAISKSKDLPSHLVKPIEVFIDQATVISQEVKRANSSIKELAGQTALYRGLATIGISSAVFGHEIQGVIDKFQTAADAAAANLAIPSPDIPVAKHELERALIYSNRVASWGKFALDRIQYGKREKAEHDLGRICKGILTDIAPIFAAEDITINPSSFEFQKIKVRIYEMDIEAVLLNFMTNAYHACRLEARKRIINVSIQHESRDNKEGWSLCVSDSGPGVATEFVSKIWDPLFTTKVDRHGQQVGTGLGLAIVKSISEENHGAVSVGQDLGLKGAKFTFWSPV